MRGILLGAKEEILSERASSAIRDKKNKKKTGIMYKD